MLEQQKLIDAVKQKGAQDKQVEAVLMYGSFTQGCGDEYADVEFYVFVEDAAIEGLDTKQWIEQVHPIYTHFFNEFGTEVVIFENLIRGEFHFHAQSEMPIIESWKGMGYFPDPDAMCLYDRSGRLQEQLNKLKGGQEDAGQDVQFLVDNMINNLLFGVNVMKRGEIARSLELLWYVQRYLAQLLRVLEQSTDHMVNPTKNLEHEISKEAYACYKACSAALDKQEICQAYKSAYGSLECVCGELVRKGFFLRENKTLMEALGQYIQRD